MIIIQSPQRRTIFFSDGQHVNLPFPYVVFNDKEYSVYVGFCNENPKFDTLVYSPPLPNIDDNYYLCIDNKPYNVDAVSYFWTSSFECFDDRVWSGHKRLQITFPKAFPGTEFITWSKLSIEDMLSIKWGERGVKRNFQLSQFIEL